MVYFIIVTLNILLLYFIRSDKKYWFLPIPLWTLLLLSFISWRAQSDNQIRTDEAKYWKTAENKDFGDSEVWNKLKATEKHAQKFNMVFLYCITLQTLITFICQIVGQRQTKQKIYKWTKPIFGVLFILAFLLIAMIGIVPTGGIVG